MFYNHKAFVISDLTELHNVSYLQIDKNGRYGVYNYTVFRKKTPTHIFFHISMSDAWI